MHTMKLALTSQMSQEVPIHRTKGCVCVCVCVC